MMMTVAYGQSTPIQILGDVWFEKTLDTVDGRVSQGLATDGVYWYFSAKDGLYKSDENYNMLIEKDGSQNPIPDSLLAQQVTSQLYYGFLRRELCELAPIREIRVKTLFDLCSSVSIRG